MAKRKRQAPAVTFDTFVHAAVFDQPRALRMIRDDPQWLTARSSGVGETALMDVVIENYVEAARFLIAQGADVNARDDSGETPLLNAASLGYREMVALLLRHAADVDAEDDFEEPALFKAAQGGHAEVCEALLQAGATVPTHDFLEGSLFDVILPRKRAQVLAVFEKHGHREPPPAG